MELAHEEQDDAEERDDAGAGYRNVSSNPGPQWSPLARSGMTSQQRRRAGVHRPAAMEPARQERDDEGPPVRDQAGPVAAMEPARQERDDPIPAGSRRA